MSVAILVVSCAKKINTINASDMSEAPLQRVSGMFAVQTSNGDVQMRMEARVMEHYETDSSQVDIFPSGFAVYSYKDDILESLIMADIARHTTMKQGVQDEKWEAFGNVVIHNVVKAETMETDTLYWDRRKSEIYTDSYVKMYSGSGFMQGYGMRSDDRARNSILLRPFNSYGVTVQDTTKVVIDSVNFIGPFPKNGKN